MVEALAVSQAVLLVLVVALTLLVFALARQIGVLHERVAPLGAAREDGRNQLFLFVSPSCPMCKKLLAVARSFMRSEKRHIWLALIGDGERSEQERLVREHKLEAFPYVISPVVGMTYQVGKLPYSVLIDERGIVRAKGLVNSREHLESLLVAKETGYASIQAYLDAKGADAAANGDRQARAAAAIEG